MSVEPGVILHVDDDAEVRAATAAVLEVAGFRQHAADSAHAALSTAEELRDQLDVVIVDYHLGGEITGTDVAEAIARSLGHALPTIILTGDPANAQIPLLSNAPVWLVRKPAHPELMMAALPTLVEFSRVVRRFERRDATRSNWSKSPAEK
jgi:CheY-like chemotaxis protein